MSYQVIDQRHEKHTFGFIFTETLDTTLTLVLTAPGKFGLLYECNYSGIKAGHISGGPIEIPGEGTHIVNPNPKVTATISNYSVSAGHISMHIKIDVDIPVIGTKTIFDQTMGGTFAADVWPAIVEHIAQISQKP